MNLYLNDEKEIQKFEKSIETKTINVRNNY